MVSGIQTTVKANENSSVMAVCRHDFHNDVIAYMLQIGENTVHIIFVLWVFFMEVIFSCLLNLKPVGEFSLYSMPEVFNKTGHGLTVAKAIIFEN